VSTDRDGQDDGPEIDPPPESSLTGRTLILIHGRGMKPSAGQLLREWRAALDRSLERDHPRAPDLGSVRVQLTYYGDLLEQISKPERYNPAAHHADRENMLRALMAKKNSKQFRRVHYEALPGKTSLREFWADIGAPLSEVLGFGSQRMRYILPELLTYWDETTGFADTLRSRFRAHLEPALDRGDDIMVISHCLGSVVAYDVFWQLTQSVRSNDNRVNVWVTLGSPLADDYVRHRVEGGRRRAGRGADVSYPDLINNWLNVAAEDDFVCHDETMENDYRAMLEHKLVSRIRDFRIYNLAESFGRSNPHSALGYLIHPRMARILNDWLTSDLDT
jgi:hypothetical protein